MENAKKVRAFASATVANVACGYDILGFSIEKPGDFVEVYFNDTDQLIIEDITGDKNRLPREASKNTVSVAIQQLLDHLQLKKGISITLHKQLPLGSGLGSSAASAVAGVVAANTLLGEPLTLQQLLPFTMEAERIACGVAHADNVAPALFGGFTVIRAYDPLDVIKIVAPERLCCAVVHPQLEVRTEDARKMLRQNILLKDAIVQWGNIAGLIAGLMKSDYDLIGRSLKDVIVEPIRSLLIPGFDEVKKAALEKGALGCSISGSGPSVFALGDDMDTIKKAGEAMQAVFSEMDIESELYTSGINNNTPLIEIVE